MFDFLDVVKWVGEYLNPAEQADVMVVEDVDDFYVTVRHLQNNQISKERAVNLRYVGKCTPYEPAQGIYDRYKKV